MHIKTVLVTGATGLLGTQILQTLIAQHFKIYATKRVHSKIPFDSGGINWVEISSAEDNIVEVVPETLDYVIHAGALVSYKKSDKEKIFNVNTVWTTKLAEDALEAGVKKFIFISSISALGKKSLDRFIDESTPKSHDEFLTNYGKSKRKAEEMLWEMSSKGLPIVIFNPSVILGPATRYQSSAQLFGYVGDQKPFYTKGLINYIDVRDVAEIVVRSLENKIQNEQFILNSGSTSYREFFAAIAKELQKKPPSIEVPKFMVMLGAVIENVISKCSRNPATLTMETAKMAGNRYTYVAAKANSAFNHSYKTLEQSIEWTVSEMKKTSEL
ncbi:Nucleoside-diphosphate-sugar epimerase [Marivirga sericea]|uniref:Nucleoside-diphosphate-sugar epimerase n=1 Tax=Marivirga sericea TaxID=1028 RepID=A0A1X7J268_9BACT|nr:NAD-dependent epimerase/dehydratase family protein [Marivirga sericea]SMG21632.1 Nucleoside-diphosphate-sugar epimerase [Marivirga sericea]